MSEPTRAEHLQWCKERALKYLLLGQVNNALASMLSDLGKHSETKGHAAIEIGMQMKISGLLETEEATRKFINGFH